MQYRKLGTTGLDVSRLCLGCMTFGTPDAGTHPWILDEAAAPPIQQRSRRPFPLAISAPHLHTIRQTALQLHGLRQTCSHRYMASIVKSSLRPIFQTCSRRGWRCAPSCNRYQYLCRWKISEKEIRPSNSAPMTSDVLFLTPIALGVLAWPVSLER